MSLAEISARLAAAVGPLRFGPPVTHVYNPLAYARAVHEQYLALAQPGMPALLLGMNPGPWGMAQTGVPFGETQLVRDWLGLRGTVERPAVEHPKRPILGLDCPRSEVSGRRLWGWAQQRYADVGAFFQDFFVVNYCPLVFMEESGRNRTPDKLPAAEREPLFALCDQALIEVVEELQPGRVIGVGRFATDRARQALAATDLEIGTILHPSPASPAANRGWAAQAEEQLRAYGFAFPGPTCA